MTKVVSRRRPARRYLALSFPWLPSDRLRLTRPHRLPAPGVPYAFVEKVKGAMRLTALEPDAARLGLRAGATLADARALVPELAVFDQARHDDACWLERLAEACTRYTPAVALDAPDGLVLDVTGCTHLFASEPALVDDLAGRLARRGIAVRHGFGPTPEAARALARHAPSGSDEAAAVRRLPVAALELDEDATVSLSRAGLKTVGDVADRPIAAIAARFGGEAATALRRLLGEEDSPLAPRAVPPAIAAERRFAEPIARTEFALTVLEELIGEAREELERRHMGGRRWQARFFRTDGLVLPIMVETGRPTREPAIVMRLFRERIDALSDPIDPGFGFDLIRLELPVIDRLDAEQLLLEGGVVKEREVDELIDRLSTRLGRTRVRRFAPRDRHLPEQAELTLPAVEAAPRLAWPAPEPGEPPLRPIHLFDPPQRIDNIVSGIPDGPPSRFRWRRTLHEVARVEGPERIAAPWWTSREAPTRDYYRVEDRRGRRFWIFRHGLYSDEEPPNWYVHGLFA